MTAAARAICRELAIRFPTSAAAEGGMPLRLSVARSFPDLASALPDVKESFLEAAEELERQGLLSLSWKRFRGGEELSGLTLLDPRGLFALLGLAYPPDEAAAARVAALDAARAMKGQESLGISSAFLMWAADSLRVADTICGGDGNLSPVSLVDAVSDLGRLLSALPSKMKNGTLHGTTVRALSIALFADSKRLERVLERLAPLISRARKAGVETHDLSALQRSYPQTLVSGRLEFVMECGDRIANEAGAVLGFTLYGANRVARIDSMRRENRMSGPRLLTVENLETFYALAESQLERGFDAVLYAGGHPNRVVQLLASSFARSGFSINHAGDLDPDGILILQELSDFSGTQVLPFRMDAATFDDYLAHARKLDAQSMKRLDLVRADTRAVLGIAELVDRIKATGKGVEQEIVSY